MYDNVLKNGWIVDGSRKEPYRADLCIRDGLIAEIAPNAGEGRETIDISGLIVSPGFIDIHAHSDASPLVGYPVESKLAQGVTTEICGNCGVSLLPSEPGCEAAVQEYFSSELEMHNAFLVRICPRCPEQRDSAQCWNAGRTWYAAALCHGLC
mgnify:CR=1 FL=1